METISDIVEALKFYPMRPGRLLIRLLRHPEPIVSLLTEPDPLSYGPVKVTIFGEIVEGHCEIVTRLCHNIPNGKALAVVIHPRKDLQRMATEAEFAYTDLSEPVPPTTGSVDLFGPDDKGEIKPHTEGSHWALPMPPTLSSTKLGRKKKDKDKEEDCGPCSPKDPEDPESIFTDK